VKTILVPSSVSPGATSQFLSTLLVNDVIALDAGCIGFHGTAHDQARVRHILLTHTHIDHLASLPIFIDNTYEMHPEPVMVHGSQVTLDCLHRDLFNNRVWPDFIGMSRPGQEFLRVSPFEAGSTIELEGVRITAVAVNHVVPTQAYLLSDGRVSVAYITDTGPTEEIWHLCNRTADLAAVFLEVTFPDSLAWLADLSKHLTPSSFAAETAKLTRPARVLAIHLKPRYEAELRQAVAALRLPRVEIATFDVPYQF
jgi:ribonuclease BN (tRNA processing enzyme)